MLDGLCCKKERSWVKCGTKGKENTQSPKVLGPMSLQHSSAMFITKNGPTTRIISINSWLWQPRIAHVMTNLAGTGMQIRWFKPNHWVSSVSEAHRLMFLSISCLICCWSLANVVFSILQQKMATIPWPEIFQVPSARPHPCAQHVETTTPGVSDRRMHSSDLCIKALQYSTPGSEQTASYLIL